MNAILVPMVVAASYVERLVSSFIHSFFTEYVFD